MTGGRFRIQFEAGRVKAVQAEGALELAYAGLFGAAQQDLAANPELPDAAIRLVVFGCCWLEANVNDYLRQMLVRSLPPRVFLPLWKATERRSNASVRTLFMTWIEDVGCFSNSLGCPIRRRLYNRNQPALWLDG